MPSSEKTKWVIVVEMAWVNPEAPEGIFARLPHAALQWIFEHTKEIISVQGKRSFSRRSRGLTLEKELRIAAITDGFNTEEEARAAIKILPGTKHADLGDPMFTRPVPVTYESSLRD